MTFWRTSRTSFWIAASSASVSASKRRTMTACVFEARTSPQPLGKFARTPSMSMTGTRAASSRRTSSTILNLTSSEA